MKITATAGTEINNVQKKKCNTLIKCFIFTYFRYMSDMGPLQLKKIMNTGIRKEPALGTRIAEYKAFLSTGGIIVGSERIIVGVKGGGLALLTAIPELHSKQCQRMSVKYKRGDVTVVVDMLKKLTVDDSIPNNRPPGTADYIRDNSGRLLQRTILLCNIILPNLSASMNRASMMKCTVLSQEERWEGLDVHRLQVNEVDNLHERDIEFFNVLE